MPYTTPDDVRVAADPDWRAGSPEPNVGSQTAASLSDAQLRDAIAQAAAVVDGMLAARYVTPVADPVPAVIGYYTRDIALYLATLTHRRNMPLEPTDPVALRYAATMQALTAVRDGRAVLQIPVAGSDDAAGGGYAGIVTAGVDGLFDAADAGYHRAGWPGSRVYPYGVDGWL